MAQGKNGRLSHAERQALVEYGVSIYAAFPRQYQAVRAIRAKASEYKPEGVSLETARRIYLLVKQAITREVGDETEHAVSEVWIRLKDAFSLAVKKQNPRAMVDAARAMLEVIPSDMLEEAKDGGLVIDIVDAPIPSPQELPASPPCDPGPDGPAT